MAVMTPVNTEAEIRTFHLSNAGFKPADLRYKSPSKLAFNDLMEVNARTRQAGTAIERIPSCSPEGIDMLPMVHMVYC